MESPVIPSLGARLSYNGQLGSVRYVGPVDGATGLWLGVEWDDPTRGKHNGSKDNKFYFACRYPTAGSFIRPSKNISYGTSFLDALMSKYMEALHGSASQETVVLGSSQGAIEIQAVKLDKIRAKLSNLARLREVSLNKEGVAAADPPGAIRNVCPNIRGLDLSMNLLPSWDVVALISSELPSLERLALNRSRLLPPSKMIVMETSFLCLTELQINGTLVTWREMQIITAFMPQLRSVEMGYNQIDNLSSGSDKSLSNSSIQVINLGNNLCSDWVQMCSSLQPYRLLGRVILTSNAIRVIPFPDPTHIQLYGIKHLSLSYNLLSEWTDIDAVSLWFPALETLSLSGNPLMGDAHPPLLTRSESTSPSHSFGIHSRPFVIARIPSLLTLDGTAISAKERTDSELFYISQVLKSGVASQEGRCQMFRQWDTLCKKHGTPDEFSIRVVSSNKLSNHLIDLELYRCFEPPSDSGGVDQLLQATQPVHLRVLPSLSLRHLRAKIAKVTKHRAGSAAVTCWLRMRDGTLAELKSNDDYRDLSWMGLESGSQIIYCYG